MRREDYIMRLIESLQGLIPYILDLVKSGAFKEAHAMIDQNLREMVGIGSEGLLGLADNALLSMLRQDARVDWREKCLFVATLLREDADIYAKHGSFGDSFDRYVLALHLFIHLACDRRDEKQDVDPELIADIESCTRILDEYHLPGRTYALLMRYHELVKDFAAAENDLFEWLQADPTLARAEDENPLSAGQAFYARLAKLDDHILAAGGLPRTELAMGRAELLQYEDN